MTKPAERPTHVMVRPAGWTDEMLEAWEHLYATKPWDDAVREFEGQYALTPTRILFRDRRSGSADVSH